MTFPTSVAAPVKGWNTRDPLAAMDPLCAPQLVNWYPREGQLETRGGSTVWASGITKDGVNPGEVRQLFEYQSADPTTTNQFFASSDDGIYDVTASGVATFVVPLTNGEVSAINFTNSAGNAFLFLVNGADVGYIFNGGGWGNITSTGVSTALLTQVWIFKRRIWAVQKESQSVHYLDIDSIGGAWTEFPVGALFRRGGHVVAGATWSVDGGDGSDDLLVLISSEGEVVVYQGSSPTSASSFSLVGVYYLGKPLSKYCFVKLGGDLAVLTHRGLFPLSAALQSASLTTAKAMSSQIDPTWTALALGRIENGAWQACVYPAKSALVITVPDPQLGEPTEIVFNLTTGAPTSFQQWAAFSIALFEEELYYGDGLGNVIKCWETETASDQGQILQAFAQSAYNYFGASLRGMLKHIELLRFQLAFTAGVQIEWAVGVDFETPGRFSLTPGDVTFVPAIWDVSLWDVSFWETQARRDQRWRAFLHPPGYALSLFLRTTTSFAQVSWTGTDMRMTTGVGLG